MTRRTWLLLVPAVVAGLAHTPAGTPGRHEHDAAAQISFDIPKDWSAADEQTLFRQGFIVPPLPMYSFVAAPTKLPSHVALLASSVPWLFVNVQDIGDPVPPDQLYNLAPNYLEQLATQGGGNVSGVRALVPHHAVHQGGLNGSSAAFTVVAPGDSTSFDEVAYERGSQVWMVIAGCSAYCYYNNQVLMTGIIRSVRVGTAAG